VRCGCRKEAGWVGKRNGEHVPNVPPLESVRSLTYQTPLLQGSQRISLIRMWMGITLNVAAMRLAFASVPYPGTIPTLSKLLMLRIHETAMVLLVVGQPLLKLPVVFPRLKRRSIVNAALRCPIPTQQITPYYPPCLNLLMAFGEGETLRLRRVLAL